MTPLKTVVTPSENTKGGLQQTPLKYILWRWRLLNNQVVNKYRGKNSKFTAGVPVSNIKQSGGGELRRSVAETLVNIRSHLSMIMHTNIIKCKNADTRFVVVMEKNKGVHFLH